MSEARYTPGPWNVYYRDGHKDGSDLPWIAGHMGRPLAFVTHETILKEDLERAIANATLIAAAPTMADYIAEQAKQGDAEALRIMEMIHAKG